MKINIELSEKDEQELFKRAKEEVREELTEEAIREYIKNENYVSVIDMINEFGICDKASALNDIQVKYLSRSDKLILMLKWMKYPQIG